MVKKKVKKTKTSKKESSKTKKSVKKTTSKKKSKKIVKAPTLKIIKDKDISFDFATKLYKKFDKLIKSVVLFGSSAKNTATTKSDIDIIIILDDVSVKWDQELIVWYREELGKIMKNNPYQKEIHINTVKLSTWWEDLMKGDPVVINILRYGEEILDFGGFFTPLKYLLIQGKIKSTPEAIYNCLQRAPIHIARSKAAELNSIEGLYWAMVDSAHAALIAANISPPSPEHIPLNLKETFVDNKKLEIKYVAWYRDLLFLHKEISHGEIHDLKGVEIDMWQERTEEFLQKMAQLVKDIVK